MKNIDAAECSQSPWQNAGCSSYKYWHDLRAGPRSQFNETSEDVEDESVAGQSLLQVLLHSGLTTLTLPPALTSVSRLQLAALSVHGCSSRLCSMLMTPVPPMVTGCPERWRERVSRSLVFGRRSCTSYVRMCRSFCTLSSLFGKRPLFGHARESCLRPDVAVD